MTITEAKKLYPDCTIKAQGYYSVDHTQYLYKSEIKKHNTIRCLVKGELLELPRHTHNTLSAYVANPIGILPAGVSYDVEGERFKIPVKYLVEVVIPIEKEIYKPSISSAVYNTTLTKVDELVNSLPFDKLSEIFDQKSIEELALTSVESIYEEFIKTNSEEKLVKLITNLIILNKSKIKEKTNESI